MTTTNNDDLANVTVDTATDPQLQAVYEYLTNNPAEKDANPGLLEKVIDELTKRAMAELEPVKEWAAKKVAMTPKVPGTYDPQTPSPTPENDDRPQTMDEVIGQADVVNQLKIVVKGAMIRGDKVPHILISGPAGYGKTTLSKLIAVTMDVPMMETDGTKLKSLSDLTGLLIKINEPTVFFIDEFHALSTKVQEGLYTAMEDGIVHGFVEGIPTQHEVVGLTVVAATTRPGLLTTPVRDRFGYQATMSDYTHEELAEIVARAWGRAAEKRGKPLPFGEAEAIAVAERSKGVPRRALNLSKRVLDYVAVQGAPGITDGLAAEALAVFGIAGNGLDETDFRILAALTREFANRTVGLDNLAQYLDVDTKTLQDQHEPYLVRMGYMLRSPSGRLAGNAAYDLMDALEG